MSTSFSVRDLEPESARVHRAFVLAVGVGAVAFAAYRAPLWFDMWSPGAAAAAVAGAVGLLVLAIVVALRASAIAARRVAVEIAFLCIALVAAEAMLLVLAPEEWSKNAFVQKITAREEAAREQGMEFDDRLRDEVVDALRAQGQNAVPGISQDMEAHPAMRAAVGERGLLPLSNVSNAVVVECNEGNGYFQFKTGEYGFNNPPNLLAGPVEVAIIGESFALGHCVAPEASAVSLIRKVFPNTANFGIAGSRVLSQLGVFREYVAPLKPPVVLWFVNVNFAEARQEAQQPLLMKYLDDPNFSQGLRHRQAEIDAFLREVVVPLNDQRDETARRELESGSQFPWDHLIKLSEVRELVAFDAVTPAPPPNMSHFSRALASVVSATHGWGGDVIVVVLPSYALSTEAPQSIARYKAVLAAIESAGVGLVDGVAAFAKQPDVPGLYTLRIDNHPNERGHALIGDAVVAAIQGRRNP